jgi:hypothetical protein
MRPRLPRQPFDLLAGLVLAGAFMAVLLTFRDYGVAWDEQGETVEGALLLRYYASGFRDHSAYEFVNFRYYGGGFELPAAALARVLPFGEYATRHLLSALLGLVGLAATWRLARSLGGARTGLLAALLLLLNPSWYGHSFINARDVPFAAGISCCLLLIVRTLGELPAVGWRTRALFGLALGLTMSVRIGGVVALLFLSFAIALWLVSRAHSAAAGTAVSGIAPALRGGATIARDAARVALAWLPALGIAYAVMIAFWPWAAESPLNPWRALTMFARFPFDGQVLFQGRLIPATRLPSSYLPALLVLTQPELLLLGVAGAALLGLLALRAQPRVVFTVEGMRIATVAFAALFPILYFVVVRPVAYNGMRHFMFVIPPLTVLAALAIDRAWQAAAAWSPVLRAAALIGLVLAGAVQLRSVVALHPDQYVYFNALAGGERGAQGRYELDYWGTSLAEATQRLTRELEQRGERPKPGSPPLKVYVCGNVWSAAVFFPVWLTPSERSDEADFLIGIAQFYCKDPPGSQRMLEVRREGAALSFVDDLRARGGGIAHRDP